MPEEKEDVEQQEPDYEGIRADIDSATFALKVLEEIDAELSGNMKSKIVKAKQNCIHVICKGMQELRESYNE